MAFREQQQAHKRRRLQESEMNRWTQVQTLTQPQHSMYALHGERSYFSVTPSRSIDKIPDPGGDRDADKDPARVKMQEMGLPEYDMVVTGENTLSSKAALEGTLSRSVGWSIPATGTEHTSSTGSIALQPNRRHHTGDVELGGVLSLSEVDLLRARSKQNNRTSVHNLVHHWRSPIGAWSLCCVY